MSWWQYLTLVNIYLLLFYTFYALLLSRETFFHLNRIYLVSAAMLSFCIPVIQADWVKNLFITQKVELTIYSSPVMFYHFQPVQDTGITSAQIISVIYIAGIVFLLGRFAWQAAMLKRVINRKQANEAFSFFKKIRLGNDTENRKIIEAHEQAHARQWHSADVLLMEILMIVNWFNPVVYLYRLAIRRIHEFIADNQAIQSGTDKSDYALILLGQTFDVPTHRLVNPFFSKSLLKQRIMMLQKNKSHRVALVKYFLSAPLFILMLILSSATLDSKKTVVYIDKKVQSLLLKPVTPEFKVKDAVVGGKIRKVLYARRPGLTATSNDTSKKDTGKLFTAVEKFPSFPGGISAFGDYLAKNIRYPAEARKKGVQGRVVLGFIVEKDGSLSNMHVIRWVGSGLDQEALRVLKASPKWQPGIQNGHPVRTAYAIPISFTLSDAPTNLKGAVKFPPPVVVPDTSTKHTGPAWSANEKDVLQPSNGITPLYVLDGKVVKDVTNINPSDIMSMSVVKNSETEILYGAKEGQGVVFIATRKNSNKYFTPKVVN